MFAGESGKPSNVGTRMRVGPQPPLDLTEWTTVPFTPAETYEEERKRRICGIRAFRNLEEQVVKERTQAGPYETQFDANLVYTVIEEERERDRRINEIEDEEYAERRKSAALTRRIEEEERRRRIREIFEEDIKRRRDSGRVTKSMEERERDNRMKDTTTENRRKDRAKRFTTTNIREMRYKKNSLKKTDRGKEIVKEEWRHRFDRNPIRERALSVDRDEEKERKRRMEDNISNRFLNEFKAKEVSKMIVNEINRRNLALK